jgi:hypothetical protein
MEALAADPTAAAAAKPLVASLGQICAGLADEAEQLEQQQQQMDLEGVIKSGSGSSSSSYANAAEAALGVAIR